MNIILLSDALSSEALTLSLHEDSTINIGKFGSFSSTELVGKRPGFSYDIVSHKLHVLPPRTIEELGGCGQLHNKLADRHE